MRIDPTLANIRFELDMLKETVASASPLGVVASNRAEKSDTAQINRRITDIESWAENIASNLDVALGNLERDLTRAADAVALSNSALAEQNKRILFLEGRVRNLLARARSEPAEDLAATGSSTPNLHHVLRKPQQDEFLIVTTGYPSEADLYANAFVHRRSMGYRRGGHKFEIFVLNAKLPSVTEYIYDGIRVRSGNLAALSDAVLGGAFGAIVVHSVSHELYNFLRASEALDKTLFYFHGYDTRDYSRLAYNYEADFLEKRMPEMEAFNEKRLGFLRALYSDERATKVFVSNTLLKMAECDVGVPIRNFHVVHNVIDPQLFPYRKKSREFVNHILSIRSYSRKNYAYDLTARVIERLSSTPEFPSLKFHVQGFGDKFEETVAPLRQYDNVTVVEGVLDASGVRDLHALNGIMLLPTRHDTQGVSMGEAMSSGLAVVTNSVTAIPEFIDARCGVLAAPEDVEGLAQGVLSLVRQPDEFLSISARASDRVRRQCGPEATTDKELKLIDTIIKKR